MPIATVQIIIALLGLVFEKGIPAVTNLIGAWNKDEITLADIQELRGIVKPPEDY